MKTYGLTKYQINKAHDKLKFNKEFMQNNGVQIDNKMIPYADFVANSYTNADRYVAELQHRAWSIFDYAKERKLKNIFITLTLPSKWHKKKTFKNKLINNKKFGGRDYICTINNIKFVNAHVIQRIPFVEPELNFDETVYKYTPRNASKELTKMLKKLFDDRSYKGIEKDDRCYFRVTEPHKDGTPHLHISLFVPDSYVSSIVDSLARKFPAPLSKVEINVESPVKYLMKYVLKTLDDLREENSDITNLTLWYLFHGISRFYTSRTFVALEVYRKLHGKYSLIDLTKCVTNFDVSVYYYSGTNKIALIENEYGHLYVPKPVNWSDEIDMNDRLSEDGKTIELDSGFDSVYKDEELHPIEFIIDGDKYMTNNFKLKEHNKGNDLLHDLGIEPLSINDILSKEIKKPYQMSYFELYNYFHSLDIETVDEKHYIYTRNLMIQKNLLEGEWLKLTAIDEINNDLEIEGIF